MKYTSIAVLLLVEGIAAVNLERDPLLSAPDREEWAFKSGKKKGPDYPINYPVANFGQDKEIANTQASAKFAEDQYGHFWDVLKKPAPEPKRDYFVPNFGVDHDVDVTLKHAQAAEN